MAKSSQLFSKTSKTPNPFRNKRKFARESTSSGGSEGANVDVPLLGSGNVRIGLAKQETPFNVPHCIARHNTQAWKPNVIDQMLNTQVTTSQRVEREKAYNTAASLLKIPYLDESSSFGSASRKHMQMGRIDGYNQRSTTKKDTVFIWTNVYEDEKSSPATSEISADRSEANATRADPDVTDSKDTSEGKRKYRKMIFGGEAMTISSKEPYCVHCPIRRGHFNVSPHYSAQQVYI